MTYTSTIKAGADKYLNKKGLCCCDYIATQAMCNFDVLFAQVLFLYTALLRSEGRTTESVVYLL